MLSTLTHAKSISQDLNVSYQETSEGVLIGEVLVPFVEGTKEVEVIEMHNALVVSFRDKNPNKINLTQDHLDIADCSEPDI